MGSHHAHGLHAPYWWLRCLVGPKNDANPAVSAYHRLLVWDIEKAPAVTRLADRVLNPLVGKSLVVYLSKPGAPDARAGSDGSGADSDGRSGGDPAAAVGARA